MTTKHLLLRGRILTFTAEPSGPEDTDTYSYIEDGALLIADGMITASGPYDVVSAQARGAKVVDHRPNILMAGFIDTHIHFPQVQVIASWGAQLLDWLNTYTFPEETRFADPSHSTQMAGRFYDQLIDHGTTTAVAYCSVHKTSADAFFTEAERRNMRMIGGKVMMDRNAPDGLRDTPQSSYDDTKALIDQWHGKGRAHYAITPRFAITSTPEQLEMAGALVAANSDCYVQTHLSENHDEIAYTAELYPDARDYLDVYQSHGLLSPKMLLGHSIHLNPREIDALVETGAHPVFCPTSNLFLGSGLFDDAGLRARGITNAIATDVGAGTSYSMLQTLNEGYKVLQLQNQSLHPLR
ncbi:guanine deaminase, partial [Falsihalocynthiibacter sp. BN13B15]|uniref:guanine deaminase n=1 Tax=Falsihalocynthiibacter sp. BN13B15 TaxID=3240871 RepID=UPI00350F4AA3